MTGCQTAAYMTNDCGSNAAYCKVDVDDLMDEYVYNLSGGDWSLLSVVPAKEETVDMEVWAQEFDDDNRNAMAQTMADGELYVAHFEGEDGKVLKVLVW